MISSRYFSFEGHDKNYYRVQIREEWFNTPNCLVTDMYELVYEAIALAEKHERVIRFKYLGLTFDIWAARTCESIVVEMVRTRTSQFMNRPQYGNPSFLTSTSWLEAVREFYCGNTMSAVHLAMKFGIVIAASTKSEIFIKRDLDEILTKYWNLIVFYSSQKEINDALGILGLAWKKDKIGDRISDWQAARVRMMHNKFGLLDTENGLIIETKVSYQ